MQIVTKVLLKLSHAWHIHGHTRSHTAVEGVFRLYSEGCGLFLGPLPPEPISQQALENKGFPDPDSELDDEVHK